MNKPRPPKLADRLLTWFCKPGLLEEIQGDLHADYERSCERSGKWKANRRYWIQVLNFTRPFALKSANFLDPMVMWRNYLKIAFRSILANKGHSLMNITGLGVGMACFLMVTAFVSNKLSYDKYHENYDRIYRVIHTDIREDKTSEAPAEDYSVWDNPMIGPALKSNFPEVQSFFRFTSYWTFLFDYEGEKTRLDHVVYADSSAFEIFSWKLTKGNPKTCLTTPRSIVITQTSANRLFGNDEPLGKTVKVIGATEDLLYSVTGVMEDVPSNSHFTFDALVSMTTLHGFAPQVFSNWHYKDFYTYLLTSETVSKQDLNTKALGLLEQRAPNRPGYGIRFEPISDAYFHSRASRQPGSTGSLWTVYLFSFLGAFILIIAAINFVNLSTARSVERAKETGIRKTMGARHQQLVFQFLSGSFLVSILSGMVAIGLVVISLPLLRDISSSPIHLDSFMSWKYAGIFLSMLIFTGVLAGSYPAWVLSRFQPIKVLKGKFSTSGSGLLLRRGLMILQFGLSLILLSSTLVVSNQFSHLQNHDTGFDQEQILVVDYNWDRIVQTKLPTIKSELLKYSSVEAVSASYTVPNSFYLNGNMTMEIPGDERISKPMVMYQVDEDFLPTYKIQLLAGRNFSSAFSEDSSSAYILNEEAVKAFGFVKPADAIGRSISQWNRSGKVIGVVKNFNYASLHSKIEPVALWIPPNGYMNKLSVRIKPGNLSATLDELTAIWDRLVPRRPFLFEFMDQTFDLQYESDRRTARLFGVFTGLAIFITCLGLFGLTTYTVSQRNKEIGIRKVLGASVTGIVAMLSQDVYKMLAISMLLAIPLSWYGMNKWLENFAYRITIGPGIYLLAVLTTLLIAMITISWQTIRAATSNPVNALRDE